jgi:anti-sigma regulatory factor (Ser/Thr protein kinase)
MMAPDARSLADPAIGSAWQPARAGQPRPVKSGTLALVTLPTSPFWARRYTRSFLDSCRGMSEGTAEVAVLIVSELVTNAVRFSGDPARTLRYSEHADAGLIALSLRYFPDGLLIEVFDTDTNAPVLCDADADAENGRGLMLVGGLAKEWSYFFPPGGGKVVYCFLGIT